MIKRLIKRGIKRENRRGSALIISLMMITLLLFLAMIYAFGARSSARQAKSATDSTQARFAAKGGLNTFLSLVTNEFCWTAPQRGSSMNPAVSFNPGGFTEVGGRMILYTSNGTDITDIDMYLSEPYIIARNDDSVLVLPAGIDVKWSKQLDKVFTRNVSSDDDKAGTYKDVSLRSMGFVVIDLTGAMLPDYNNEIGGDRIGADIFEIVSEESMGTDIKNAIDGLSDSHTSLESFLRSTPDVFLLPANTDSMLMYNLVVHTIKEQYWDAKRGATSTDSIAVSDELFERIDITTLDSRLENISVLYDSLLGFEDNPSRDDEKYFCPWLKSLKVTNSEARAIAAQFAINICDKVDDDSDDADGTTLYGIFGDIALAGGNYELKAYREDPNEAGDHPVGPANVAAISQRIFGVDNHMNLSAIMFEAAVSKRDQNIKVDVTASARMVNTMDDGAGQKGTVEYVLELTFETNYETSGPKVWTTEVTGIIECDGTTKFSTSDNTFETSAEDEQTDTSPAADNLWDTTDSDNKFKNLQLKNIKIISLVIKDTSSTINERLVMKFPIYWDDPTTPYFAQLNGAITANCELTETSSGNSYFFGFIAKDPNFSNVDQKDNNYDGVSTTFDDYWITINSGLERDGAVPTHKTNHDKVINVALNNLYYTNGDEDVTGAVTEDVAIGSVDEYYGNARIKKDGGLFTRVGELGRLPSPHTQKRSIRFWSYTLNRPSGLLSIAEENKMLAGSIAEGRHDAHLLSMFKAGPDETKVGTVNLNGSYDATFRALFSGIVPPDFTAAEASTALQYVNGITKSRTGNLSSSDINQFPFSYRGEIIRMFPQIVDDTSATHQEWSDIDMDEFIEKFIELTNTRQNYYMVYVSGTATGHPDGLINAVHKIKAIVCRDAWKNKVVILRMDAIE